MKNYTSRICLHEGGEWINFKPYDRERARTTYERAAGSRLVHAIQFEDGSIWDAVNGWRDLSDYNRSHPTPLKFWEV